MFKKGFTLVELLAVIIILGVIIAIIVPVTNSIINNSKQSAYDSQIDLLVDQALKYSVTNDLGTDAGIAKTLQFEDLINDGLIQTHPEDPITGGELEGCIVYTWESSINQYVFEYSSDCTVEVIKNKMISGPEFNSIFSSYSEITNIYFQKGINYQNMTFYGMTFGEVKELPEMSGMTDEEIIDLLVLEGIVVDVSLNHDKSILVVVTTPDTLTVYSDYIIEAHEDSSEMFYNISSLENIEFTHNGVNMFDTSNVTNMSMMFASVPKLINLDLSSFDTSNVTDMSSMFVSLNGIESLDLSNFDTSNVMDYTTMFSGAENLVNLNLTNWVIKEGAVTEVMFCGTYNLTNIQIASEYEFIKNEICG